MSGIRTIERDHAVFVTGALLALLHLLDELLTIRFPVDEVYRLFVFVGLTAAAVGIYPKLGLWKGPVGIIFGIGWTAAAFAFHVLHLLRGQVSAGDISGIAEFVAGLVVFTQAAVLTRNAIVRRQHARSGV